MIRTFFTFGPDHVSDKVPDPLNQYVEVHAPAGIDARSIFMDWLGSNRFAFEYTAEEFDRYRAKYPVIPAAVIEVTVR